MARDSLHASHHVAIHFAHIDHPVRDGRAVARSGASRAVARQRRCSLCQRRTAGAPEGVFEPPLHSAEGCTPSRVLEPALAPLRAATSAPRGCACRSLPVGVAPGLDPGVLRDGARAGSLPDGHSALRTRATDSRPSGSHAEGLEQRLLDDQAQPRLGCLLSLLCRTRSLSAGLPGAASSRDAAPDRVPPGVCVSTRWSPRRSHTKTVA